MGVNKSPMQIRQVTKAEAPAQWLMITPFAHLATVPLPIAIPAQRPATPHHCAGQVAARGRDAPCRGPGAARASHRAAPHGRTRDRHVPLAGMAVGRADEVGQGVSGGPWVYVRARLSGAAGAIHFACRNAGQANMRASAHHIGPSPSQIRVGEHAKVCPEGALAAARSNAIIMFNANRAHSQRYRCPVEMPLKRRSTFRPKPHTQK